MSIFNKRVTPDGDKINLCPSILTWTHRAAASIDEMNLSMNTLTQAEFLLGYVDVTVKFFAAEFCCMLDFWKTEYLETLIFSDYIYFNIEKNSHALQNSVLQISKFWLFLLPEKFCGVLFYV